MKYANLVFWVVMLTVVSAITVRGILKQDFSASGKTITRVSTPRGYWVEAMGHVVVCLFLAVVVCIAAKRAFSE